MLSNDKASSRRQNILKQIDAYLPMIGPAMILERQKAEKSIPNMYGSAWK